MHSSREHTLLGSGDVPNPPPTPVSVLLVLGAKVELAEVPLVAAVVEEATRGCAKGRQEGTERTEGRAGQTVAMETV